MKTIALILAAFTSLCPVTHPLLDKWLARKFPKL